VLLDGLLDAGAKPEKLAGRLAASRAGENVIVVWRDAELRTHFIAPPEMCAFFALVTYAQLEAQVNGVVEG